MAIQTTLADLRLQCKQRFDVGTSQQIGDAEFNQLINQAGSHLHNWVVTTGEDYIIKMFPITAVTNQMDYALPSDFFKDLKFWAVSPSSSGPSYYTPMGRMMKGEFRGGISAYNRAGAPGPSAYMILGNVVRISPVPVTTTSLSYEMWYAPHYRTLVSDVDVMDVSIAPGWDEFVVNQVVINCRLKEESPVQDLMVEQERIKKMIEDDIMNRDMGKPQRVVDASSGSWPYGPWGLAGWEW